MMGPLYKLIYRLIAPWLRQWLNGRIVGKPIAGTSMVLYYDKGQHLGFLGRRSIQYEHEARDVLGPFIRRGSLIFEIGSNIGQHSLWFADRAGTDGRVVCVEPDPDNLAFLHFNVRKNRCKQVDILPWAIADKAGKAVFYRDALTGGRSGTLVDVFAMKGSHAEMVEVETRTYRDLLRIYGQPDLVKVDVEGAEALVFPDDAVLHHSTVYFVETRKETHHAVFSRFSEAGFKAKMVEQPNRIIQSTKDLPDFCNLLFVHPDAGC